MAESTTAPNVPKDAACADAAAAGRTLTDALRRMAGSAREAAEAQAAVWSMKAMRAAALAVFGLAGLLLTVALLAYGFFLLDTALAAELHSLDMPAWFSPLVRGGAYFMGPLLMFAAVWHLYVGYGKAPRGTASAADETADETSGREGRPGCS